MDIDIVITFMLSCAYLDKTKWRSYKSVLFYGIIKRNFLPIGQAGGSFYVKLG
jgi:hypothetical protein